MIPGQVSGRREKERLIIYNAIDQINILKIIEAKLLTIGGKIYKYGE